MAIAFAAIGCAAVAQQNPLAGNPCMHGAAMTSMMQCAQSNNINMQDLHTHLGAIAQDAGQLGQAIDDSCTAYEDVRPCWSEITTFAHSCFADESHGATQGPPPGVRVSLIAHFRTEAMRCLPHLCDIENTRMVSKAISRVVAHAAKQGNVRQLANDVPPQQQQAMQQCMQLPATQRIMQCVAQHDIAGRLQRVQPVPIPPHGLPSAPFGRTEFCGIYHAVEPCWADISAATTGCMNDILATLPQWSAATANQRTRPEQVINCLLQPVPQYCSTTPGMAATIRKIRHATVPMQQFVKAVQKEQQAAQGTSPFATVSAFVLIAAIVGAVAVYRKQPAAEVEKDAVYGTI